MKYVVLLKHITLFTCLCIAGCGGGGSSTPESKESVKKVITVIDGYLHNASICIDRNSNSICDVGEKITEKTNELGQVKIDLKDAQYPLIAQITAGVTTDSDKATQLEASYELIAPANADFITPFSTLAVLDDISLLALSAKLNVNYDAISTDYIANTEIEFKAAHLIARAITPLLHEKLGDNDRLLLNEKVIAISELVAEKINADVDLSTIEISFDDIQKVFYSTPKIANLKSLIVDKSFIYSIYSNHYIANGHFYDMDASFSDKTISLLGKETTFSFAKNILSYGDSSFEFLIANDKFMFSFAQDNTPGIWADDVLIDMATDPIENSFVAGKTIFHLRDINNSNLNQAEPILTKLVFDDEGSVIVTPEGEEGFIATWEVMDWSDLNNNTYRIIYIDFPLDQQKRARLRNEKSMRLEVIFRSPEISVATNFSSIALITDNFLIENESLANLIYNKWRNKD